MLISTKHKFVFLCNPKNASNSIELALKPFSDIYLGGEPEIRHFNYREFEELVYPVLTKIQNKQDFMTICVFREPVSWLYSWYRFRSRRELSDPAHPNHMYSTKGITFTEFVTAYISDDPPLYATVGNQYDFIKNQHDEIGVDRIFSYEGLDEFVRFMSERVQKKIELKNRNVSPIKKMNSKGESLVSYMLRKLTERFNLKLFNLNESKDHHRLPEDLYLKLKSHISKDFEIYKKIQGRL